MGGNKGNKKAQFTYLRCSLRYVAMSGAGCDEVVARRGEARTARRGGSDKEKTLG